MSTSKNVTDMKLKLICCGIILLSASAFIYSCNKPVCENCDNGLTTGNNNKAPIAMAGPDRVITLPIDSVVLDGSASSDPDGSIISWEWNAIGDFAATSFVQTTNTKVTVDSLVTGIFLFELKVTDDKHFKSFDTVQVIVNGTDCIISGRPLIHPLLTEIGTLSETRESVAAATAGTKVVFAGGYAFVCGPDWSNASSAIDIYDVVTGSWTISRLSAARMGMTAIAAGNKIFFAGGNDFSRSYDNVDIYDVVTNTWSVSHLSRPETNLSAAVLGDKIFFSGVNTDRVDIYNLSSNTWTTANLSAAREGIAVVATSNKIYFAGGVGALNTPSNIIDIYDNTTNSWSTSALQELKGGVTGAAYGDKIFWLQDTRVEIMNTTNGLRSFECLAANYSSQVMEKNGDIIFVSGIVHHGDVLNVYNASNGSWSQCQLSASLNGAGVISSNNKVYAGGGWNLNTGCQSNKVYSIEW